MPPKRGIAISGTRWSSNPDRKKLSRSAVYPEALDIEFYDGAIETLFAEIGAKIEQVDQELRASFTGKSTDLIVPTAANAFSEIGVHLPESDLNRYTQSVADNEDFEFVLR